MINLFGTITTIDYLIISIALFIIGLIGISLNRKSIISLLVSIELMLLSVNINFVSFSNYWGNYEGQVFSIFILTVAAAEAAIGLAILICYYRNKGNIETAKINHLKG